MKSSRIKPAFRSATIDAFAAAVGRIQRWSAPDRALLGFATISPFIVLHLVSAYSYRNREWAAYMDPRMVEWAIVYIWGLLLSWIAMLVLALYRRKRPTGDWILHLMAQVYSVGFAIFSYAIGHYTNGYQYAVGLGGAATGSVAFGNRPVLAAAGTFFAIVAITTVLEQMHLIPYAPLMATAPWADGHLAPSWVFGLGGVQSLILWFALLAMSLLVEVWRRCEHDLERTSDQLAAATDLISRYIASQLADQIRTGNFEQLARPQRRRIVVFFSDIVGFTETADRVEPEDLSRVLNEYLTEMTSIAKQYGGMIDKFVGDAIMILFGAPQQTDDRDHALRAVRMAVAMQEKMVELRKRWADEGMTQPFSIRIGINTGYASVGNFGSSDRLDYTAIGREVNLAARLQVVCAPGRILVSASTWSLVSSAISGVAKGSIVVKGIQAPVNVYEVDPVPGSEATVEDAESTAFGVGLARLVEET